MGKPRLIIIIRHAQSEGNRDKTIHQTTPDHRVGLTPEGHEQAREAGEKLRQLLRNDDRLHFFISPYRRTRETTEGILSALCSNDPTPSPFQRPQIKVYEEPRIREQDFGNFQPGTEETERLWRERAAYGHFFYRIPNGESGADVYDRVSSFNGSLWRRFSEDSMASVAILVTHGLCSRVFLMAWYHYSVEFFEDLRNINHCEFLVMKLAKNGRYVLQNQLRRWSDLKRERAQRRSISQSSPEIPVRKWGSTRSHQELAGKTVDSDRMPRPHRQNTIDLFKDDEEENNDGSDSTVKLEGRPQIGGAPLKRNISNLSSRLREVSFPASESNPNTNPVLTEEMLPAPAMSRDFAESASGRVSPSEAVEDEASSSWKYMSGRSTPRNFVTRGSSLRPGSLAAALRGELDDPNTVMADALGDQSDADVEEFDLEIGTKDREEREMAEILANEKLERIQGSFEF